MERNVKAWLVLAIFVMAFVTGHVTEGIRDVPNPEKEEVYKPELLGGLLGPAWGLGVVPAVLAALWPIAFLRLCCGGPGPGWVGSSKELPPHKGDAGGGYKPPSESPPKGDAGDGYKPPNEGAPEGGDDATGGYKPPKEGAQEGGDDASGGYKLPSKGAPKGGYGYDAFMANSSAADQAP